MDGGQPQPAVGAGNRSLFLYVALLIGLSELGSPHGGLIGLPLSFVLKNKLHLSEHALAFFMFSTSLPLYLSFLFGFLRDKLSQLGSGDKRYIIIFGVVGAFQYAALAFFGGGASLLIVGLTLITCSHTLIWSGWNGLSARISVHRGIVGEMSVIRNIAVSLAALTGLVAGGLLSNKLEYLNERQSLATIFLIGGIALAGVGCVGVLQPGTASGPETKSRDSKRLVLRPILEKRSSIIPAMAIWFLWNFSPGMQTPLQYFLTDTAHLSDAQYGGYNALFVLSHVPLLVLFGVLSKRWRSSRLLWLAAIMSLPQVVPLAFVYTPTDAMVAAVLVGAMGGMATGAYTMLLIRNCPDGCEGTVMMLSISVLFLALRTGDLLGTTLVEHGCSFRTEVAITTLFNLLILPILARVNTRNPRPPLAHKA